jgi:hypothetical protein
MQKGSVQGDTWMAVLNRFCAELKGHEGDPGHEGEEWIGPPPLVPDRGCGMSLVANLDAWTRSWI